MRTYIPDKILVVAVEVLAFGSFYHCLYHPGIFQRLDEFCLIQPRNLVNPVADMVAGDGVNDRCGNEVEFIFIGDPGKAVAQIGFAVISFVWKEDEHFSERFFFFFA